MDIVWDAELRDISFAPNGDFEVTDNPSAQNGAIMLQARAFNILQPVFGIGFNSQVLGGTSAEAAFELNRWVAQVQADKGRAKWERVTDPRNEFSFKAEVNYL